MVNFNENLKMMVISSFKKKSLDVYAIVVVTLRHEKRNEL